MVSLINARARFLEPKVSFACDALRFKTNEIICCLTSKKITRSLERKLDIALLKRVVNSFFLHLHQI